MFWNLCKSSWRKGFLFELLIFLTLLLARCTYYTFLFTCSSSLMWFYTVKYFFAVADGECSTVRNLGCGKLFEGHSLKDGEKAGLFNKLGRTDDVTKCVEYCCDDRDCKTALFVAKLESCYTVDCKSSDACKPVQTSEKYGMSIFQKPLLGKFLKTFKSSIYHTTDFLFES